MRGEFFGFVSDSTRYAGGTRSRCFCGNVGPIFGFVREKGQCVRRFSDNILEAMDKVTVVVCARDVVSLSGSASCRCESCRCEDVDGSGDARCRVGPDVALVLMRCGSMFVKVVGHVKNVVAPAP